MHENEFDIKRIITETLKIEGLKSGFIAINPYTCEDTPDGIIFFKPEICSIPFEKLNYVLDYFKVMALKHSIHIQRTYIITGEFLTENNVINEIYKPIANYSLLSSSDTLSTHFHRRLTKKIGKNRPFAGGLFLALQGYTPDFIMKLWQNSNPAIKIDEDCYAVECLINNKKILLINGFLPSQMEQYNKKRSKIIFFTFQTEHSFENLKTYFQGNANAANRPKESIRQYLSDFMEKNSLEQMTPSRNGIHLSSNRIEGERESKIFKEVLTRNSLFERYT